LAQVLDLALPAACLGCGGRMESPRQLLCGQCQAEVLPISEGYCVKCGSLLQEDDCPQCKETEFAFDLARSAYAFTGSIQALVHSFKYDGFRSAAGFFARSLLEIPDSAMLEQGFDLVTAVPLHRVRRRERGFNQSELIARQLAKSLALPYSEPVYRRYNTPSQTLLSRGERIRNLHRAFALRRGAAVEGKNIILVDDVFTTGSTVNEISALLKANGAMKVMVLTAARAV